MKNFLQHKLKSALMLFVAALTAFAAPSAFAQVYEEEEAGKWQSIGIGQLVDGWTSNGATFDVEIQQNKNNPNIYRVWEPYKDYKENTGKTNNTKYHGQIVFDISDPDNVIIWTEMPIGYYYPNTHMGVLDVWPGEMYATNGIGYALYMYGFRYDDNVPAAALSSAKNMGPNFDSSKSTFADNVVTLENSCYLGYDPNRPGLNSFQKSGISSKIILPKESEKWEMEEGKWESIGMGQLVDGWVTQRTTFDVDIQRHVDYPNLYRVWEPYKDLESKTGLENKSEYHGQIVFEISDPDNVCIVQGKPLGYYYPDKRMGVADAFPGEMYASNGYGYALFMMGVSNWADANETILKSAKNMAQYFDKSPTTYSKGVVTIPTSPFIGYDSEEQDFNGFGSTNTLSEIILPKEAANWEFVTDADYFDFTIDGADVGVAYNPDTKSYKFENLADPVTVQAMMKPDYLFYGIGSITCDRGADIPTIIKDGKGFTINNDDFAGKFKFTVSVVKIATNWELYADDDYFTFSQGETPVNVVYNTDGKLYKFTDLDETQRLHAEMRPEIDTYKISNITFEKNNSSSLSKALANTLKPNAETNSPTISDDGRSFDLNPADFVGAYRFNVEMVYAGPLIIDVQEPVQSLSQNSVSLMYKYNGAYVPKGCRIRAYYGPASQDSDTYTDWVSATVNGATVTIPGLQPNTDYTYNVVFAVIDPDDQEIFRTQPVSSSFRTKDNPVSDPNIDAKSYMWDETTMPENKYGIATFWAYRTGREGSSFVVPELTPSIPSVLGTYFNKMHNESNGKRELTLLLAHMLPNPPYVTEDQKILNQSRFFIAKNPSNDSGSDEIYFYPTPPADYDDKDGEEPYSVVTYNNQMIDCPLTEVNMRYYDDSGYTGSGTFKWGIEKLPYFSLEVKQKVYNVVVIIGFDEDDVNYETPKYFKISYEEEPQTALIGTITQTSTEFNPENDNVGGWHTWVKLIPTGDSENPYPYVYDFIAQEESYDLSFTFDNKPYIKAVQTGENGALPQFYLQEIYPHNMAWNADFETPKSYQSETKGRTVRPQQTNYYPGYIGPHIDGRPNYAPSHMESILLTDLVPGHHYQLMIEHPSFGWETDPSNPTFTYQDNALGYITLVDNDVKDGTIEAYQLVQDTNNPGDYYTYDFKKTGSTYKVKLDSSNNVESYEKVTDIDESNDYKDARYQFTDKFFVFADGYEYEDVDQNDVSVHILNAQADLVFTEKNEVKEIDASDGQLKVAAVFSINGLNKPLDPKEFDIQRYWIEYQRGYRTCPDNTFELFTTDRPVKHWLMDDYWDDYYGRVKKSTVLRTYDPETIKFPNISTTGQLVIPTPAPDGDPIYSFASDGTANATDGQTIDVRIYADDLLDKYGKTDTDNLNVDYIEMTYSLLHWLDINSHEYNVSFPYERPNVTDELGDIMESIESPKTTPNLRFRFSVDDSSDYDDVEVLPYDVNTPGFYNAHLGTIYDQVENKGNSRDTRTLDLAWRPEEFPGIQIYDRWGDGMTAKVGLDLNAPLMEVDGQDSSGAQTIEPNIWRNIRQVPGHENEDLWEETLYVKNVVITNTEDNLIDKEDNELNNGDSSGSHDTLYAIDFNDFEGTGEPKLILATKYEIERMNFVIAVSEEKFKFDEWPFWSNTPEEPSSAGYLNIEDYTDRDIELFSVRNVYLFPVDNDGLKGDTEVAGSPEETSPEEASTRAKAPELPVSSSTLYHGVTTPPVTAVIKVQVPLTTGADDLTTGDDTSALAAARDRAVEIFVDGADLFRADGTMIATGKGTHSVVPGIYIVSKGKRVQKLMVR